jgi:hypothetical protein
LLEPGTKVRLKTFNNTSTTPEGCDPSEDYWSLIGEAGTIKQSENDRGRVLVQFDISVESKGLHCHNEVKNSLLILTTDLEEISE